MKKIIKTFLSVCLAFALIIAGLSRHPAIIQAESGDLGEGYNLDNLSLNFTTIDGETINSDSTGKITLLVFLRTNGNCYNSNSIVKELDNCSWAKSDNVRILLSDVDGAPLETVKAMHDEYNKNNDNLKFCYNSNYLWDYYGRIMGSGGSVTLPAIVFIDKNNKIQYLNTGSQTAAGMYEYVKSMAGGENTDNNGESPEETIDLKLTGTLDANKAYEVLELVNKARKEQGLSELVMDDTLIDAAMQRAAETSVYWSHTRPDNTSCFTILNGDYRYGCAENIAAGSTTADRVMDLWLNSPGHYANIMGDYNTIGIGCFVQDGTYYWTQMFSVAGTSQITPKENSIQTMTVSAKNSLLGQMTLSCSKTSLDCSAKEQTELKARVSNLGFGSFVPDNSIISYKSSDISVATVDNNGIVTAVGEGDVTITASIGNGIEADFDFKVYSSSENVADGMNKNNLNFDFTTVDDEIISSDSSGKVTLLVFARTDGSCMNSNLLVEGLCKSSWTTDDNVKVLIVDVDYADFDTVNSMRNKYGLNNSNIKFCYRCYDKDNCLNLSGNLTWNQYYNEFGSNTNASLPMSVIIDKNNKVQYFDAGYQTADGIYEKVKKLNSNGLVDIKPTNSPDNNPSNTPDNKPSKTLGNNVSNTPGNNPSNTPGNNVSNTPDTTIEPTDTPFNTSIYRLGDLNLDNTIDLQDTLLTLKAALSLTELTYSQHIIADINEDFSVDLQDAADSLKTALGIYAIEKYVEISDY